ncbi:MAG TPA: cyclase family protein [Methanoregulaceae archaeon]|nr:cyclase family protein [Methanoregulaceae archaeon]HOV68048.1 cyclase family protein [Methanoregulaceae archaeon]HQJ87777.1 cyclase family protein [Methanoregulaceae archaeon]
MVRYIDVTRVLSPGVVTYPGDLEPRIEKQDTGDYLISSLTLSSHSGTHIDAPDHFLRDGRTVDRLPLDLLIGPCRVLETQETVIGPGVFEGRLEGVTRVLFRTWFSRRTRFVSPFPALTPEAARSLAASGVRIVGTDGPSIEPDGSDGTVHRTLLARGGAVIELLDLSGVPPGDYRLIALPLRVRDGDGAPARVVLEVDG